MRGALVSIVAGVVLAAVGPAGAAQQQGLAMILAGKGVTVLRSGDELPLGAPAGELLYEGDTIRAGDLPAEVLYCPSQEVLTLGPHAGFIVTARKTVRKV